MDFIVENYMWFIIGGIVILMAVVGYIADVTDFGRNRLEKETKEKVENPKKEKVKREKIKKEKSKKDKVLPEVSVFSADEINEVSSEPILDEVQDYQQDVDLEQSNENLENNMFSNELKQVENNIEHESVDQSLFEPLPSVDQVFQTANKPEDNFDASIVDGTVGETEVSSDEDIWKF